MTRTSRILMATVFVVLAGPSNAGAHDCLLCRDTGEIPVVHLDAGAIDSIGTEFSDRNLGLIERIETAYQEGRYGTPGTDDARADALAAFIYNASVAFDFFLRIALQERVIYTTSEEDLKAAFTERFRNPGIYPIINLLEARTGFGRFCLRFGVEEDAKREIVVSGEKMRAWTETLKIGDVARRVVNIDMKTFSHDRVHVVYEKYSCGTVHVFDTEVEGHPVQVYTMEELQGQYVRKFGFHKAEAVAFWKAPARDIEPPPRDGRFLGSAIYFPHLRLDLPWFLPSIGFHDLRKFEFPEPVLTMEATRELQERKLDWLHVRKNMRFANWEGDGAVPPLLDDRFPDY